MGLFHSIGNSFKDEKDDDDSTDEMRPNVNCLVVDHKQGFYYLFGRIIADSVSLPYVLIVLHVFGNLLKPSHVLSSWIGCGMPSRLLLLLSHLLNLINKKLIQTFLKRLFRYADQYKIS